VRAESRSARGASIERTTVSKRLTSLFVLAAAALLAGPVLANADAEALVKRVAGEVIDAAKADRAIQAGDVAKVIALVDAKVMPEVNFEVMTRSAVGPQWRSATPEQRTRLQAEFKTLLARVYSGALAQIKEQTVEVTKSLPVPSSTQVVVQSEVRGKGEPIKLDYRMDRADNGWKIIDVNVGGIWLVQSYRSQFAQEISAGGLDGLIARLVERNKVGGKS
jgi:phospholipid transport system substrate-binding protein